MHLKLPDFSPFNVLVVGDLMLDRYLWGEVERISPEAPVPVVRLSRESDRVGGAGNVSANLAGLGLHVQQVGYAGVDAAGDVLVAQLADAGIDVSGVLRLSQRATITKTRIIGGHQQMLRLDHEQTGEFTPEAQQQLIETVLARLKAGPPNALVLSDYAKGCLSTTVCQTLIEASRTAGVPVFVDPKGLDFEKYRGATCLTPNKREAADICAVSTRDTAGLLAGLDSIRRQCDMEYIVLTRGEEGMSSIGAQGVAHYPASARQVFDVSGAGDTVIATLAAAAAAGLDHGQACMLANLAAGIVVGKVGTVPIELSELQQALQREDSQHQAEKVCDLEAARIRVASLRAAGKKVVFTNGCFDLLHVGHVTYLEQARGLGDALVVGLNTDRSVRALKGPSRPVIGEDDRARVLAALESVDAVVLFDEETPLTLIQALRPDVLAKGDDYREDQVVGAAEVKSWGGRVCLVPIVPGRSSSEIVARMAESHQQTCSGVTPN
jgi:D-beta-D-heptose 7-phosphate kinase / D-beta-D-heptose 1-phosphate adenosyltransferase